jgi:MFS family permease
MQLVRYAVAAGLARIADEMVGVSVVLLVLGRTGDPALAGVAVAGYTLPAVLTGPLLGAWLAGARRPKVALAANELVLAGVTAALIVTVGRVPGVVVVVLTLLAGASLPLTSGGFSSLLPPMVGEAGLPRANTVDATTINGASIAGPAIAGTSAAAFGPGVAVGTIAVTALLSVVATVAMPAHRTTHRTRPPLFKVARDGLAHLARTPPLRAATLASMISYGCVGLLIVALPAKVVELGAPRAAAGYLWTALEAGGLAGGLLLTPRLRRFRPEYVVFGAVAGYGAGLAAMAVAPTLAVAIGVAVVAGVAEGPCLPSVFVARQRYSPGELLAQVATTGVSLKIGAFALGSVLSGALTGPLGPTGMILLAACGQLVAAVAGMVTTSAESVRTP